MKVQVENKFEAHNSLELVEFQEIINLALDAKSIEVFKCLDIKFETLTYGYGSNHIWVKQIMPNGQVSDKRLLLITK